MRRQHHQDITGSRYLSTTGHHCTSKYECPNELEAVHDWSTRLLASIGVSAVYALDQRL